MQQQATTKMCVGCGTDVSQQKRVKDGQGNYYCHPCWAARTQAVAQQSKSPSVSTGSDTGAGNTEPPASPPDRRMVVTIVGGGTMLGLVVVGLLIYFLFVRDRWEHQNGQRLQTLTEEAKVLVRQEKLKEAQAKYKELFGLLGDRQVRDPQLQQDLADARTALNNVVTEVARQEAEQQAARQEAEQKKAVAEEQRRQEAARRAAEQRKYEEAQAAKQREEAARLAQVREQQAKAEREQQERATKIDRDPGKAFREFATRFIGVLNETESPEFFNEFRKRTQRNRYAVIDGTAKIDVRKTDSVLSPYVATLEAGLVTFANGDRTGNGDMYRFTFAAQEHKWVLQSTEHYSPSLQRWSAVTSEWNSKLLSAVMGKVENP